MSYKLQLWGLSWLRFSFFGRFLSRFGFRFSFIKPRYRFGFSILSICSWFVWSISIIDLWYSLHRPTQVWTLKWWTTKYMTKMTWITLLLQTSPMGFRVISCLISDCLMWGYKVDFRCFQRRRKQNVTQIADISGRIWSDDFERTRRFPLSYFHWWFRLFLLAKFVLANFKDGKPNQKWFLNARFQI